MFEFDILKGILAKPLTEQAEYPPLSQGWKFNELALGWLSAHKNWLDTKSHPFRSRDRKSFLMAS
jgi:hypothetical protein